MRRSSASSTAVLSEAWAKLRADFLILPRELHSSLLEIGERENNKRCVFFLKAVLKQ